MNVEAFFIVGPLRTGSSLLARCLDDHPQLICFCESEINRTLFEPYLTHLHFLRMRHHGFGPQEIVRLLDRKQQNDVGNVVRWYREAKEIGQSRFAKPNVIAYGDKSPDFFLSRPLVSLLLSDYRLLYSIRDPRAIFCSIESSEGSSDQEKRNRWNALIRNWDCWEPHLDRHNVHAVRYEDVISDPSETLSSAYRHIGVHPSLQFLEPFERRFPSRFLWKTAIDWETGIQKDFDVSRIGRWREILSSDQLEFVKKDPTARRIMDRFGYSW
ncbi:sulfotransferase family protein [Stieleria tagensis]|uniref:sulfotransferase family protein n=1 Tax=Stieleria tagensis TaxID=2956795 RepID=UPI0036F2E8A2